MSNTKLRMICYFRMGSPSLPVEQDRPAREGVSRCSCGCTFCTSGASGDERHCMCDRPQFGVIRRSLHSSLFMHMMQSEPRCGTKDQRLFLLSYWPSIERLRHEDRCVLIGHCWLSGHREYLSLSLVKSRLTVISGASKCCISPVCFESAGVSCSNSRAVSLGHSASSRSGCTFRMNVAAQAMNLVYTGHVCRRLEATGAVDMDKGEPPIIHCNTGKEMSKLIIN